MMSIESRLARQLDFIDISDSASQKARRWALGEEVKLKHLSVAFLCLPCPKIMFYFALKHCSADKYGCGGDNLSLTMFSSRQADFKYITALGTSRLGLTHECMNLIFLLLLDST